MWRGGEHNRTTRCSAASSAARSSFVSGAPRAFSEVMLHSACDSIQQPTVPADAAKSTNSCLRAESGGHGHSGEAQVRNLFHCCLGPAST
jgi:hypothetical protein